MNRTLTLALNTVRFGSDGERQLEKTVVGRCYGVRRQKLAQRAIHGMGAAVAFAPRVLRIYPGGIVIEVVSRSLYMQIGQARCRWQRHLERSEQQPRQTQEQT